MQALILINDREIGIHPPVFGLAKWSVPHCLGPASEDPNASMHQSPPMGPASVTPTPDQPQEPPAHTMLSRACCLLSLKHAVPSAWNVTRFPSLPGTFLGILCEPVQ